MKTLFEYAVIYNPSEGDERPAAIIIQPTTILAKSSEEVNRRAVRAIPDEYVDRLADIQIVVRPF